MDRTAARQHVPKLVKSHHAHSKVHGVGLLGDFNRTLAIFITKNVGTMYCAYLFAVLGVSGIVAAVTNNTALVLLIGAVSGYFLQLVLLPIIIVGQNVQAESTDARAMEDHQTLLALHTINVHQLEIIEGQAKELQMLRKLFTASTKEAG